MTSADEDEIWRSIVENYGERALPDPERRADRRDRPVRPEEDSLSDAATTSDPAPELDESQGHEHSDDSAAGESPTPFFASAEDPSSARADESGHLPPDQETERFVPPRVHSGPPIAPGRRAAWAGVIGAPLVFLLLALIGQSVSRPVGLLLIACLVAGFGYLVWTMSSEPRDPFDDGSRV